MTHFSYAMGQARPIAITARLPLLLGLLPVFFAVIGPPPRLLVLLTTRMLITAEGVVNCSEVIDRDAASWALPMRMLH
jgi:hypothetical protein